MSKRPTTAAPALFVRGLADAVADDGLLILSTPNRTPLSRLAMITVGESVGGIPRGTHDWNSFLTPDELTGLLGDAGLAATLSANALEQVEGLSWDNRAQRIAAFLQRRLAQLPSTPASPVYAGGGPAFAASSGSASNM